MMRVMQSSGLSTFAVAAMLGFSLLVIVAVGNHLVKKSVIRPLEEIASSASRIAEGHAEVRVSETGPAEIVALAQALNQLTRQLLQNQTRLADNVRSLDETNQELIRTQRDLVQAEKMASLGHLSAGVAHEIGNPLGSIMGYISLQKRRGGDAEIVDGLEREARRIDRIVRELLEYARPASERRVPIEVNGTIRQVVDLLREQGWLAHVEVRLDFWEPLPELLGDLHRFEQIFVNLLRNAESAMDGEGVIQIKTTTEKYQPDRPVAVRRSDDPPGVNYSHLRRDTEPRAVASPNLKAGSEVVRIQVCDTGHGIPEETRGSIFDPFFTTKGPGQGTGLGLAIVAGSVSDLGGRIEASSGRSGGACFTLWLPAAATDA